MKKLFTLLIILLYTFLLHSYVSPIGWNYISEGRFTIYYPAGEYIYAKYTMNNLRTYADSIDTITGNKRGQNIRLTLENSGEYHNGAANPLMNKLIFFTNTPGTASTFATQDWLNNLAIHEYTHASHLGNAKGLPHLLSRVLGNVFSPNFFSPLWIVEGITVRNESHFSPYTGRLNNGYNSAVISAKARADKLPNVLSANYYLDDFPYGNYYIYGGAIVDYLSETYGEASLSEFFDDYGNGIFNIGFGVAFPSWTLDRSAKRVFGSTFPEIFEEWSNKLKSEEALKPAPPSALRAVDWKNTLMVDNLVSDSKDNIFFSTIDKRYKSFERSIVKFNVNKNREETIHRSNSSYAANFEVVDNSLFFAESEVYGFASNIFNRGFGNKAVVSYLDLESNKKKALFSAELKDFAVVDKENIFFTSENNSTMNSTLHKYSHGSIGTIKELPYMVGEMIYKDNFLYFTYKFTGSSWDIGRISVRNLKLERLVTTYNLEKSLHITDNKLYFTSNPQGVSKLFSLDLKTKSVTNHSGSYYCDMGVVMNENIYFKSVEADGERIASAPLETRRHNLDVTSNSQLINLSTNDDYVEKNALIKSVGQLFLPYTRLPLVVVGADGIGYLDYSFFSDTNDNGSFYGFNIHTSLLQPLDVTYMMRSNDVNEIYATLPIYKSARGILDNISLATLTDFDKDHNYGLLVDLKTSRDRLKTTYFYADEEDGYEFTTTYSHYLSKAKIYAGFSLYKNYDDEPIYYTGNYKDGRELNSINYSLGSDLKLFEVRNGFWTPNLAIKDVYLTTALHRIEIEDDRDYNFAQVELNTNLGIFSGIMFNLGFGSYISEDDHEFYFRMRAGY